MTSPFGKVESPLKTLVDEDTHTAFLRKAAHLEQVTGELLRNLVYLYVHGETLPELVAKHQRSLMSQQGLNADLLGRVGK
mgnify:CR=1 FL=1